LVELEVFLFQSPTMVKCFYYFSLDAILQAFATNPMNFPIIWLVTHIIAWLYKDIQ